MGEPGHSSIPGVFSPEQITGWRLVTDAEVDDRSALAQADHTLFFSHGDKGYIDWPVG